MDVSIGIPHSSMMLNSDFCRCACIEAFFGGLKNVHITVLLVCGWHHQYTFLTTSLGNVPYVAEESTASHFGLRVCSDERLNLCERAPE
jgi:hypothetical protein